MKASVDNSQINHNPTETVPKACNPVKVKKLNVKDEGWGWVVVFSSFMSHLISDGIIYAYGVLAPEYILHFGITRSQVGWMGSILIAVTMATGILSGYLCKKFSCRSVALVGSIVSIIGFGVPYLYPKLWFIVICSSLVCGIGFGLVYMPSILIVNDWFDKKKSLAIGIAVCGAGVGTLVFSSVFELLLQSVGWQKTMLISAILLVVLIPCSLSYSEFDEKKENQAVANNDEGIEVELLSNTDRNNNVEENAIETNGNDQTSRPENPTSKSLKSYLDMMKNPIYLLYLVSVVFSCIAFNAPYMFMKDRALQVGLTSSQGTSLISSIGIGNCLGRVIFGFVATLKGVNRFHLYNSTRLISGVILIISWFMNYYSLMITYTAIYGLMSGAFVTLTSIILGDIFGQNKLHITFGISLLFQGISMLVGPPLAGMIFDATNSFDLSFAVCGTFITISALMMYLAYISRKFRKISFYY